MNNIILQIVLETVEKIEKKIYSKHWTFNELTSSLLEDAKALTVDLTQEFLESLNQEIRDNKAIRKEKGLVLKEKNRKRTILSPLGEISFQRDYYYNKKENSYLTPVDEILEIQPHERITENICAKLVEEATEVSYAKSAKIVSETKISRQTVRNCILKAKIPETKQKSATKKTVKELHIYADEDHVHLQKPKKQKGKKIQIVPLITITEGTIKKSKNRKQTINPTHFVNKDFNTKKLWEEVDQYIQDTYNIEKIEKIYIHADGGQWIKNGLEDYAQREMVIDGFHIEREITAISKIAPKKNIRKKLNQAFIENNKDKAIELFSKLLEESNDQKEKLIPKVKYILAQWDGVVNRKTLNIPGSCTEGQVSHILSQRFSRDPLGWSKEGLGRLSKLRVHLKNGGKITSEEFRKESKNLSDMGKEAKERIASKLDFSIFEKERWDFERTSGTQIMLRKIGRAGNWII